MVEPPNKLHPKEVGSLQSWQGPLLAASELDSAQKQHCPKLTVFKDCGYHA